MNAAHTEEYEDLLVVEALGVADADERQKLDELFRTPDAQTYVARASELSDAAAMLAFSAVPVNPAEETRPSVLASIRTTEQIPSSLLTTSNVVNHSRRDAISSRDEIQVDEARTDEAKGSNVYRLPAPTVTPMPGVLVMRRATFVSGLLAASLLLAALAGLSFMLWRRGEDAQAQIARVQREAQAETTRQANEARRLQQELAREQEVADVIAAPEARFAILKGTASAPAARARLVFDPRTKRAVLYSHALPPAPQGKAYQIWYITDGKPLPGGLFTTNTAGDGSLRDTAPAGSNTASAFAVTLEQAAGALSPQGTPVLSGIAS